MSVLGPAVREEPYAREEEPVALTVRFGIDHPACELRQARFLIEMRELGELEQPQLGRSVHVLLDEQRRLACIGLPVHLAWRVAVAKRSQAQPLVRTGTGVRARAGVARAVGRHRQGTVRVRIHQERDGRVHPGPGAEQPKRLGGGKPHAIDAHDAAGGCRERQLESQPATRRQVGRAERALRKPRLEVQPRDIECVLPRVSCSAPVLRANTAGAMPATTSVPRRLR